jgi:DNA-binding transcriptional ArsR family regulator
MKGFRHMIRYELAGTDLAGVRFAVSPLNELVLSLRAWVDPGRYPANLPWLRKLRETQSSLDTAALLALTNDNRWTPDFLTPRPRRPVNRIEDELAAIARTDGEVLHRDIRLVHPHGALPHPLRGSTALVRTRILDALWEYWRACFEPHWARMSAMLDSDVNHRARLIVRHGLAGMFASLGDTVRLADSAVTVRISKPEVGYTRSTTGGLTLVPTMWSSSPSAPISALEPPMIMYGARGQATVWEATPPVSPSALVHLLGTTRAALLLRLAAPASSTELAVHLGVTTSAVNQHLRALHTAGLLERMRHGRSVLYQRSDIGERLCAHVGQGSRVAVSPRGSAGADPVGAYRPGPERRAG